MTQSPNPIHQPEASADETTLKLARRLLWIAFCWNDHNFEAAHIEARLTAEACGIKSFEQANEWLATQPPSPPVEGVGEQVLEVWNGDRKVTIYVGDVVLRIWGANINDEMSDEPYTQQAVQDALAWLYAAPPARSPLTTEQIAKGCVEAIGLPMRADVCDAFNDGVKFCEAKHGILPAASMEAK